MVSLLGIGNIEITATSDGTDTKVQSGTGKISIIGNGSVLNPYTVKYYRRKRNINNSRNCNNNRIWNYFESIYC
jgi:hypothetical protein